ncbi:MAG: 30S ribosome-binding factor RbfA [Chloroflexi bacterium]|nr:30S ribosome-binding factor RbfA [Chloroflexota bacterium]
MTRRAERLNELLREEISYLLAREMKDPRLSVLITITRVDISADFRMATVYASVLGTAEEKGATLEMLKAATGYIQRELKPKLALKYVPSLVFRLDESIEEGMRMFQLMDSLQAPEEET